MISKYYPGFLQVSQVKSATPLRFVGGPRVPPVTLSQFIDKYVPEFADGSTDTLSPCLFNGHLQTSYAGLSKFFDIDEVNFKRLMVTYPDGSQGALDFAVRKYEPSSYQPPHQLPFREPLDKYYSYMQPDDPLLRSDDHKPMLVCLHGLTGGSHESYIRTIIHDLIADDGFEACVLNSRGCCQSQITTPQLYNGGWTNDIRYVMDQLFQMYPNRTFYMVGFSLGASILSNYIGEQGDRIADRVRCAVVFGNPWDLLGSWEALTSTTIGNHIYSPLLTKNLVKLTNTHVAVLGKRADWKNVYDQYINAVSTVKEFDDVFTGPMFGYKDATEYYNDASSWKRLSGVRIPLIGVNSLDDPIVGFKKLHEEKFKSNPYTLLVETNIGGHIAWFKDLSGRRWYSGPICRFFREFHKEITMKGLHAEVDASDLPKDVCAPVRTTYDMSTHLPLSNSLERI